LRQYKDTEKTRVNLVRKEVNRYCFVDTSREIIGMLYTADWCVCVCVCVISVKSYGVVAFALV